MCESAYGSHPCCCDLYSVLRVSPRDEREDIGGGEPQIVGVEDGEGTPVPIPNTAVKLTRVDDTWLEAARDNR